MILVDADFLIGIYLENDVHHQKAITLIDKIEEEIAVSFEVINEVVTKLDYFKKRNKALIFISDIYKTNIKIIYLNYYIFTKAIEIFKNQKITHVSLTDCVNMAIMKTYKIKKILSFDKVYEKNGFSLVK